MQKTLNSIKGLGSFDMSKADLSGIDLDLYIPLESVADEIKEYVAKDCKAFQQKYPQSRQFTREIGLLIEFINFKFSYDILVEYVDNDLDIDDYSRILSENEITLSSDVELAIKKFVLRTLKREIFGE